MKDLPKGYIVAICLVVIAVLVVGGIYFYRNNTAETPAVVDTQNSTDNTPSQTDISVKVISPNGGEEYEVGKTYEITWTSNSTENVDIALIQGAIESGMGDGFVAMDIPNTGSYMWTVSSRHSTGEYRVGIGHVVKEGNDIVTGEGYDASDSTFTIINPNPPTF